MCGIAGIFSSSGITDKQTDQIKSALHKMHHRGPDHQSFSGNDHVLLGHSRLSIIDTSSAAHQPFYSEDKKYAIVFNGEIFNFPDLKNDLLKSGNHFKTRSDTEVLLQLLIKEGKQCLNKLNGFFAFAFYNFEKNELWLVRDRLGEKPLKYFYHQNTFAFASDLNALKIFHPEISICTDALQLYFQYNYIPAPFTIYEEIYKVMPGEMVIVNKSGLVKENYYSIESKNYIQNENDIKSSLKEKLIDAVKIRMISDVPLGSFLSGGIDSTIISGIAHDLDSQLQTYSIGFSEHKHFDETEFALLAAKHLNTKHEVFDVTGKKLLNNMDDVIGKMDEPFADSSSLAVYELTRQTKSRITVALSGDGADELFGGYHKHLAHQRAAKKNATNLILKNTAGIWKFSKGSRHTSTGNAIRKIKKYAAALKLHPVDRYIRWASVLSVEERKKLFHLLILSESANKTMDHYFRFINHENDLNEILFTDILLVLANDMLVKTDMMSMANSLEVRPPFLDYRILELSIQIPEKFKIKKGSKKDILKETFREYLPDHLINRPKKGFEVPLHSWFNNELKKQLDSEWMNSKNYKNQTILSSDYIELLKKQIFSVNPGDSAATIWALIVLREWMKKNNLEL